MRVSNSSINTIRNRSIALPNMGPFASLIFLLVGFYMLSGHFKWPDEGVVPESKMAYSIPKSGCHIPYGCEAIISLNAKNQLSFHVESAIQATIIRQISQHYNVRFTPLQLINLEHLPFLSTNVENLPELLSLPAFERSNILHNQLLTSLSEQQLMACIGTARKEAHAKWHVPMYVSLVIDANTELSHVEHLTDLLQTRGINRFKLMTLAKRRSGFN